MNKRMNEWMNEWMNDWKNELNDGKYKITCNHVISFMSIENYDMMKDMIEVSVNRWISKIINEWKKGINK